MSGYIALAFTSSFGQPLLLVALITTVGGFAVDRAIAGRNRYRWVWNVLALCYLIFAIVDIVFLSGLTLGITGPNPPDRT